MLFKPMEIGKALIIMKSLAKGTDPISGEDFDENSPYRNHSVFRALYSIIEYFDNSGLNKKGELSIQEKQYQNIALGRPKNDRLPWTNKLKKKLSKSFNNGQSIENLARTFGRTESAIGSELVRQGLLKYDALNRRYYKN